jgi:hypothetical protein
MGPEFRKVSQEDEDDVEPHLGDLAEEEIVQIHEGEPKLPRVDEGLNIVADAATNLAD